MEISFQGIILGPFEVAGFPGTYENYIPNLEIAGNVSESFNIYIEISPKKDDDVLQVGGIF